MKVPFLRLMLGSLALAALSVQAQTPDDAVRLNQIQVIGTHNSYPTGIAANEKKLWLPAHADVLSQLDYQHPALTAQLSGGVRQLELDVFGDKSGGRYADPAGPRMAAAAAFPADPPFDPEHVMAKPGFKVMHVQDVDYR